MYPQQAQRLIVTFLNNAVDFRINDPRRFFAEWLCAFVAADATRY